MRSSASGLPLSLDCQRCEVPHLHFCSALTAKDVKFHFCTALIAKDQKFCFCTTLTAMDLKFGFHTFALPVLLWIWSSASALLFRLGCQRSEVLLPHFRSALTVLKILSSASAFLLCLNCQRSEVLLLHFCSALTVNDLKFCFCTSALPGLSKIWSSASALLLCLDCQTSEILLLHFCSAWTVKDLKFCFCTSALPWLSKIWNSASALLLCLDFLTSAWPVNMWSPTSAFPLYVLITYMYFHTFSCCLTWRISPLFPPPTPHDSIKALQGLVTPVVCMPVTGDMYRMCVVVQGRAGRLIKLLFSMEGHHAACHYCMNFCSKCFQNKLCVSQPLLP